MSLGAAPKPGPAFSCRVETFTSENNELWKKVETLENANRWVVPPASCPAPASVPSAWHSSGRQEKGVVTEFTMTRTPETGTLQPRTPGFLFLFTHSSRHLTGFVRCLNEVAQSSGFQSSHKNSSSNSSDSIPWELIRNAYCQASCQGY